VATEPVTYLGALDVFAAASARTLALPCAMRDVRLAYVMAGFNNPTGAVMDVDARSRLLRAAADEGVLVVDDQAVTETWFGARPLPPPLASLAAPAQVVTIGSISKIVWGGLRVGWLRAARSIIEPLTRLKGLSDLGSSVPSQLVAATLVDRLDDLKATRLPEIRRRRDAFVDELRAHLPEWRFDVPDGGLALWVDIGVDANEFASVAAGFGVGVLAGTASSADGSHTTHLRLGYGLAPDRLVEGVRRLAAAWQSRNRDSAGVQAVV
jgi:DNA-binding transcriptional MocR family regulator